MDEELHQLEAELRALRPAALPSALTARIARELAPTATAASEVAAVVTHNVPTIVDFEPALAPAPTSAPDRAAARPPAHHWWLWSGSLAAAAAIAVLVTSLAVRGPGPAIRPDATPRGTLGAAPAFKPVSAENVLVSARDEGLLTLEDGTAARRERLRYVDTITWRDPRTNASVRWTVPREEVRVVPVLFQ
ncbi:MAG: hypothetical protein RLZZ15_2385 [Verrucomicrobiota bacterium]|jgi:hypothetical protein